MKSKQILKSALVGMSALMIGISGLNLYKFAYRPEVSLKNTELCSSSQLNSVNETLRKITPKMRRKIESINFLEKLNYVDSNPITNGLTKRVKYPLHGRSLSTGQILINLRENDFPLEHVTIHEISHLINDNQLTNGWAELNQNESYMDYNEVIKRRLKTNGFEFGFSRWDKDKGNIPSNGFVGVYASTSFREDLAEFVTACYLHPDVFSKNGLFSDSNKHSRAYKEKLILAKDYGLISKEQYKKILGN